MSRYYSVFGWLGNQRIIHLSFTSRESGVWPHTLCNQQADSDATILDAPNCILCIGIAFDYDQRLQEAQGSQNPCAEILIGALWSGHE